MILQTIISCLADINRCKQNRQASLSSLWWWHHYVFVSDINCNQHFSILDPKIRSIWVHSVVVIISVHMIFFIYVKEGYILTDPVENYKIIKIIIKEDKSKGFSSGGGTGELLFLWQWTVKFLRCQLVCYLIIKKCSGGHRTASNLARDWRPNKKRTRFILMKFHLASELIPHYFSLFPDCLTLFARVFHTFVSTNLQSSTESKLWIMLWHADIKAHSLTCKRK